MFRGTGAWDVAGLHRRRADIDRYRYGTERGVPYHGSRRHRHGRGGSRDASRRLVGRRCGRPTLVRHAPAFPARTALERGGAAGNRRRSARRRAIDTGLCWTQVRRCGDCPIDRMRRCSDGSGLVTSKRAIGIGRPGPRPGRIRCARRRHRRLVQRARRRSPAASSRRGRSHDGLARLAACVAPGSGASFGLPRRGIRPGPERSPGSR